MSNWDEDMIEVTISGLGIDGSSNSPVVILKEKEGKRVLPIWIGHNEASAIAMELAGVKFKRPLTHDLLKSFLVAFKANLIRVVIGDLKDNTYYASLFLKSGNETISIDARPSDSIALALRVKSPIFTSIELLTDIPINLSKPPEEYDPEKLRDRLKGMNPEDFGKFSL
jgi:bifunctional DNase/RNase